MTNDDDWYVTTMDEGVITGPFATKREAVASVVNRFSGMTQTTRHRAGLYELTAKHPEPGLRTAVLYIGLGRELRYEGWE